MWYKDQLVLTGRINDVGAYTRTNIPESYRAGIELQAYGKLNKWLRLEGNISLSQNKVRNFTEFIYDENGNEETRFYKNPDIAFSPAVVTSGSIIVSPVKQLEITVSGKYVSRQYLDNTEQRSRSLPGYYVQDLRAAYSLKAGKFKESVIFIQVNNLFSKEYEANGYTYSYLYGGSLYTENFYFPMAPINLVAGLNIKL
jgi:iron complex outermembrane receptor protein